MALLRQTTALTKISQLRRPLRIIQGGTSASKTFSVVAYLIHTAQSNEDLLISIVSESMPHLKKGAMRDFMAIMVGQRYFKEGDWNKTDSIYTFPSGSRIEFFSADQPSKVRGPRRDILFLNECNNVSYETFDQLYIRTRRLTILDFNPVSEFWLHEEVIPHYPHDFLRLTYKDNEALSADEILKIESHKHNENWWRIYGLGETGINEGQIFTNWKPITEIPEDARLERHGLDFGFTNDPSAIVDAYRWNKAFILDEVLYDYGKSNKELANAIRLSEGLGLVDNENYFDGITNVLTIGDSAEPKSIKEIKGYGVKITGALKGPDSINYGIQVVQDQEIYVTTRSLNIFKEQRNYLWKVDRDGKSLNVPIDDFNHAMDAIRYEITDLTRRSGIRVFASKAPGL